MRKPKRKYIIRNFALYRLAGMMGNLAHMVSEFKRDTETLDLILKAMDSVSELGYHIKVHRGPVAEADEPMTTVGINTFYTELTARRVQ